MSEPRGAERECPHHAGTGTGNPDEYRCDECGVVYRFVADPNGECRGADGMRWRIDYDPAPLPCVQRPTRAGIEVRTIAFHRDLGWERWS